MKAVLVLNGEPPGLDFLRDTCRDTRVYAADGGARVCQRAGVAPDEVIGDFDSVDRSELPSEWRLREIRDEDSTDFEKVLRNVPEDIDEFIVLGAFGKRLDHMITNVLVACAMPDPVKIRFEDPDQMLVRVTPDRPFVGTPPVGSDFSLLPISHVTGVRSTGLHWDLDDDDMSADLKLSQSNRVVGPVRVEVAEGCLFVWMNQYADA